MECFCVTYVHIWIFRANGKCGNRSMETEAWKLKYGSEKKGCLSVFKSFTDSQLCQSVCVEALQPMTVSHDLGAGSQDLTGCSECHYHDTKRLVFSARWSPKSQYLALGGSHPLATRCQTVMGSFSSHFRTFVSVLPFLHFSVFHLPESLINPLNPIVHFWLHHTVHCTEKKGWERTRWERGRWVGSPAG